MGRNSQYYLKVSVLTSILTLLELFIVRMQNGPYSACPQASEQDMAMMLRDDKMILHQGTFPLSFTAPHSIGCHNIHEVTYKNNSLGRGVNKKTYKGHFRGQDVAIKMATVENNNGLGCIDDSLLHKKDHTCYRFGNFKLMKDIVLSQGVDHPRMLRLLGYCYRSEEMKDKNTQRHGLVSVFEWGTEVSKMSLAVTRPQDLSDWSSEYRINETIWLTDLMQYFQQSPFGNLRLPDLKSAHFLSVNNHIKMFDLDDATAAEPECSFTKTCSYNIECVKGRCLGYNTRETKQRFYNSMRDFLYTAKICENPDIKPICSALLLANTDALPSYADLKSLLYKTRNRLKDWQPKEDDVF